MRILFIHEVNYLTKPIFEMHEFPEHLAKRGHKVAFLHFPEGLSLEEVRKIGFRRKVSGRALATAQISLFTAQNTSGSALGRLATAMTAGKTIREVCEDFRPEVIINYSVPTSGWQAVRLAKKLGIPFVFRSIDVSHKIRKTIFEPLVILAERYLAKKATSILVNNTSMGEYCISNGAERRKIEVLYPPSDVLHFSTTHTSRNEVRSRLGISETCKLVVYLGSFFYFSGINHVLEDMAKDTDDSTKLLLIGSGEQETELRKMVKDLNLLRRVIFAGFVDYENLPNLLSACDLGINPMQVSAVSNFALPNKIIQYIASGLPVVSTNISGAFSTFCDYETVTFVSNSAEIWSEAKRILETPYTKKAFINDKQLVSREFSIDNALISLEHKLMNLIEASSNE